MRTRTFGSKQGFHFCPPYPCLVLSTTYETIVFGSRPKVGDIENKALTSLRREGEAEMYIITCFGDLFRRLFGRFQHDKRGNGRNGISAKRCWTVA